MRPNLLYLFPVTLRPEKVNFAGRFTKLSDWATGSIFTLSNCDRDDFPLGQFTLFSRAAPNSSGKRALAFWRLLIWRAWRYNRKKRPSVIIAYDPLVCGIAGVILKWVLGIPLVIEVNGDHHEIRPSRNSLKSWLMRRAFRFSLARADAIKVLNTSQERFVRARYPKTPVFRFMDFVAEEFFRSLSVTEGDHLLSVGHPFEFKGVGELIEAFHQIADRHPHLELRIMGWCPPELLPPFTKLAKNHPRIHFLPPGWVEDVGEQMRSCYALVNASHFEAGGRVIFEAMACRKPVVATRTNGPSDYVQDGVTGLLCEIRNSNDLADKLDRLVADRDLARRMGQAGYDSLRRDFSEADYIRHYREMLASLGVVVDDAIASP